MSDAKEKDALTRRGFLGVGSAALAAASLLSADELAAQAQEQSTAKPATDRSASDPGPTNSVLDAANPDSNHPVPTDAGGVQTFKYPFSFAHKRQHEGGWSREVTQRELAISTTLAGVDMRLTAGGVRELHWHSAAEWAFMLYGSARITCIDFEGKSFVTDVKEGDLWFFPTGIPHSIQGLAPDGCEFLLVFDDGNFSEYATVLLSDFMAHTPPEVVAKNFGVNQQALAAMPKKELFIFQAEVPGALAEDRRIAAGALGPSPI
ncbi:MAG: cupin domain-containing protein, partial [Candidatus Acidiferrales bacterium]